MSSKLISENEDQKKMSEVPLSLISIDLGSTQTKIRPEPPNRGVTEKIDFKPKTGLVEFQGISFRIIGKKALEELFRKIEESIQIFKEETDSDRTIKIITLTGFTNSLGVYYKKANGEEDYAVLLDDPSLATELTVEQKAVLTELNIDPEKKTTSVRKLIALENNPEVLKLIFGEDCSFEVVKFSTMMGMIEWYLNKKNPRRLKIPYADIGGFGRKDLSPGELEYIFKKLGLKEDQFKISSSPFEDSLEGMIFAINDFEAELRYMTELLNQTKISAWDIIIGLDSVGKIVFHKSVVDQTSLFKADVPFRYLTQRMTANVISEWFTRLGFVDNDGNIKYLEIDKTLEDFAKKFQNQEFESNYFYLPDKDSRGWLLKKIDSESAPKVALIDESKFESLNEEDKQQAFFAIAIGMVFGIREKILRVLEANSKEPSQMRVLIYGGLSAEKFKGWRLILRSILGEPFSKIISVLNIPDANIATANILAKVLKQEPKNQILESQIDEKSIQGNEQKNQQEHNEVVPLENFPKIELEDYWRKWLEILGSFSRNSL